MAQVETDRATLRDQDGNLHEAVEMTNVITAQPLSGPARTAKGSKGWYLTRTGRPLNTDDDQSFEDLDGRAYTRV